MAAKSGNRTTGRGIVIGPHTAGESGDPEFNGVCCRLGAVSISHSLFDALPWTRSDISAALGVPVQVAPWPSADNHRPNDAVLGLFVYIHPQQNNFGKVRYRSIDGAVILARTDGKELREKEVAALLTYISEISHEITAIVKTEQEDRVGKAEQLAGSVLTKEAFDRFLESRQAEKSGF